MVGPDDAISSTGRGQRRTHAKMKIAKYAFRADKVAESPAHPERLTHASHTCTSLKVSVCMTENVHDA